MRNSSVPVSARSITANGLREPSRRFAPSSRCAALRQRARFFRGLMGRRQVFRVSLRSVRWCFSARCSRFSASRAPNHRWHNNSLQADVPDGPRPELERYALITKAKEYRALFILPASARSSAALQRRVGRKVWGRAAKCRCRAGEALNGLKGFVWH